MTRAGEEKTTSVNPTPTHVTEKTAAQESTAPGVERKTTGEEEESTRTLFRTAVATTTQPLLAPSLARTEAVAVATGDRTVDMA